MLPETLEGFRPLMKWAYSGGVGSIKHVPSFASNVYQPDVSEHPEMLGHRRLLQAQAHHDVPHRALLQSQIIQDLPAPGLSDRVERIRCGSRSCHRANNTYPYRNMSRTLFGGRIASAGAY